MAQKVIKKLFLLSSNQKAIKDLLHSAAIK